MWQKAFVLSSLAVLVVGGLYAQPVQAASACKNITLTAHRGYVDRRHTENTYRAFMAAANKGTDAVEFDIRLTSDGMWMVMHDDTVNRTTNGKGKIAAMTAENVRKLRVKDSNVTGVTHRVPYFSTVLGLQKKYPNLRFQIEFKPQPITDTELSEAITMITNKLPLDHVLITSSNHSILQRIRAINTDVTLAYINQTGVKPNLALNRKAGINYINADYRDMTKESIAKAHSMGLKVSLRSANKPADWHKVVSKHADNLVTDNMVGYTKWCK